MGLSNKTFIDLRNKAGLTQGELAARIGVARTAISKIEHNDRDLTFAEALAWAEACGASIELIDDVHGDAARLLGQLSDDRLALAARLLTALRTLEDPHLVTLEALLEGWTRRSYATDSSAPPPHTHHVKKL